jgi:hypothetical protein
MKRTISWVAGLCLVALVGCAEDMGPVTAAWNQLVQTMSAKVDALKSQYASMQAAVKALPAAADADAAGKAQKGKLDQALASHGQTLAALDTFISTSKGSFDEAVKTGKVANAQKVFDDTKARFEQLSGNLTPRRPRSRPIAPVPEASRRHAVQLTGPRHRPTPSRGPRSLLFDARDCAGAPRQLSGHS